MSSWSVNCCDLRSSPKIKHIIILYVILFRQFIVSEIKNNRQQNTIISQHFYVILKERRLFYMVWIKNFKKPARSNLDYFEYSAVMKSVQICIYYSQFLINTVMFVSDCFVSLSIAFGTSPSLLNP